MPSTLSLIGACGRDVGRAELVGDYFVLMLVGKGES